jgi:hypothetical protein
MGTARSTSSREPRTGQFVADDRTSWAITYLEETERVGAQMGQIVNVNRPINRVRWRWDTINGTRSGPFADGTYLSSRTTLYRDMFFTPGFAEKKRKGEWLPEQPYVRETERQTCPTADGVHLKYTQLSTGNFSEYIGPLNHMWNTTTYLEPTISEYQRISAQMSTRLLSKIKGMKVNLGNFIAERDQMFNMFTGTAKKLVKAYRQVRKGQYRNACRTLGCAPSKRLSRRKSAANNWLELQYGWLPLYSDLYEASLEVEKAYEDVTERPPLNTARAKIRQVGRDTQIPQQPDAKAKVDRQFIFYYRGTIHYVVDTQASAYLGSIGLTNPLSIAWEVVPFSFVADWFLPIGRALENLDATLGCSFRSGSTGFLLWSHLEYFLDADYVKAGFRYEYKGLRAHGRWFEYRRTVLSGFPSVTLPQPKNPLSAAHAANALALLTQAFSLR